MGNKADMTNSEKVSYNEASDYALKSNILHKTVSAKKNMGIDDIF